LHKITFLSLFLYICFSISGCDSATETKNLAVSTPLKWQQPHQRINGETIQNDEILTYEIWAGYSADSLLWIYTHSPNLGNTVDIELNIASILQQEETSEQFSPLSGETLYFGIIAIDEDNNRSAMSNLKLTFRSN